MKAIRVDYKKTKRFPPTVLDYLDDKPSLKPFITAFPGEESLRAQIQLKKGTVNREVLCRVIEQQYEGLCEKENVLHSIRLLAQENTFTICTAHQPNIFLGPFYVVLKTIHAITLAEQCNSLFPEYNFVPVFYIGSEDHDIDEIGTLHYGHETMHWQPKQWGACGEMKLETLQTEVEKITSFLSDFIEDEKWLKDLILKAYQSPYQLAQATRTFLHELFGERGLIVFDANNHECKTLFKHIIGDELLKHSSEKLVLKTISEFSDGTGNQATPREINLFYKQENQFRERIIQQGERFDILNQQRDFSEKEILEELEHHPENFSPNVILRPLLQETILPNIAFVGGGAEISYWLQLKSVFDYHHMPYPLLVLRQSVMTIDEKTMRRMNKHALSFEDIFLPMQELLKQRAANNDTKKRWHGIEKQIKENISSWLDLGSDISPNLKESAEAHVARMEKLIQKFEKKFDQHIIRKESDFREDLEKIFQALYPNQILQERHSSFLDIWKNYGRTILFDLYKHMDPFGRSFLLLVEEENNHGG